MRIFLYYIDDTPWCIRKENTESMKYEEHEIEFDLPQKDVLYMVRDNSIHWFQTLEEAQHYALRQYDKNNVYVDIYELGTNDSVYDPEVSTVESLLREPFVYINNLILQYRVYAGSSKDKAWRDALDMWNLFCEDEHQSVMRYISRYPDEAYRFKEKIPQYYHLKEDDYPSFDECVDSLYLKRCV